MSKTLAIQQGRPANTVQAAVTTVQLFPDLNTATLPALLTAPAAAVLDGKPFQVVAAGECTTSGAYNVKVGLYAAIAIPGTPLTAANWTLLKASTARAVGTTSAPWLLEAKLVMGSTSGKMQGTLSAMINLLYDTDAVLGNGLTVVPASMAVEPAVYFCVGIDFSTGAATNIGYLKYFALEC